MVRGGQSSKSPVVCSSARSAGRIDRRGSSGGDVVFLVKKPAEKDPCLVEKKKRHRQQNGGDDVAGGQEKGEENDRPVKGGAPPPENRGRDEAGLAGHHHEKGNLKGNAEGEHGAGDKGQVESELGQGFEVIAGVAHKIGEHLGQNHEKGEERSPRKEQHRPEDHHQGQPFLGLFQPGGDEHPQLVDSDRHGRGDSHQKGEFQVGDEGLRKGGVDQAIHQGTGGKKGGDAEGRDFLDKDIGDDTADNDHPHDHGNSAPQFLMMGTKEGEAAFEGGNRTLQVVAAHDGRGVVPWASRAGLPSTCSGCEGLSVFGLSVKVPPGEAAGGVWLGCLSSS